MCFSFDVNHQTAKETSQGQQRVKLLIVENITKNFELLPSNKFGGQTSDIGCYKN